jgi:hypothetical protein
LESCKEEIPFLTVPVMREKDDLRLRCSVKKRSVSPPLASEEAGVAESPFAPPETAEPDDRTFHDACISRNGGAKKRT